MSLTTLKKDMADNITLGFILSIVAGLLLGTFAGPMKKIKYWQWENTWLIFSLGALIVLPIVLVCLTVPNILDVYEDAQMTTLLSVFAYGAGWGIANIGFGIGLNTLGLALGTAIVLGLSNAIGAILPIAIYSPGDLNSPTGLGVIGGVATMLIGITVCSLAGAKKQKVLKENSSNSKDIGVFIKGLTICVLAGIFGGMLNFALIAGKPLEAIATENGASILNSANVTWVISLSGGFVITSFYCIYLFRKNLTFKLFKNVSQSLNWGMAFLMSLMWFGGVALYGMAVMNLGKFGASIGWPLIQSMAVASGNVVGIISGEWKGTGKVPLNIMLVGLFFLFAGMAIIGWAGTL